MCTGAKGRVWDGRPLNVGSMPKKTFEVLHANLYILVLFVVVCLMFGGSEKILWLQYFYWGRRRLCA